MISQFKITWVDAGREPQVKPDPRFPNGIDIDMSRDQEEACTTGLPYPARRCGHFVIECERCHTRVVLTTAGRPDDPRSVRIACKAPEARS